MIVGVVGSRNWPDPSAVVRFIEKLAAKYPGAVVVSGGARGPDSLAERAAEEEGLGVISYRPYDYLNMQYRREFSIETFTIGERAQEIVVAKRRRISPPFFRSFRDAAFHRNGWIVEDSEHVVAFWNEPSTGTRDTIDQADKIGRARTVYKPAVLRHNLYKFT